MPKFLGIIGSIIGAMVCITIIAAKQGDLPEASKLFGALYDLILIGGVVGIIAAAPVFLLHSIDERLGLIKACFLSVLGLGLVIFVFLLPPLLGGGVGWSMASDLMQLVYFAGFSCGIGHYILYRIGFRSATKTQKRS